MKIRFAKPLSQTLKKKIEGFEIEVGVLNDTPHKNPVEQSLFKEPDLSSYAGGPVRKKTRTVGPLTTGQILVENMKRLNINLLWRPFQETNSNIMQFTKSFLNLALNGQASTKRVENLLQAIVRNPILKQEYGKNKAHTADAKGFDRHLFDTGQMFRAITAKVKRVRK